MQASFSRNDLIHRKRQAKLRKVGRNPRPPPQSRSRASHTKASHNLIGHRHFHRFLIPEPPAVRHHHCNLVNIVRVLIHWQLEIWRCHKGQLPVPIDCKSPRILATQTVNQPTPLRIQVIRRLRIHHHVRPIFLKINRRSHRQNRSNIRRRIKRQRACGQLEGFSPRAHDHSRRNFQINSRLKRQIHRRIDRHRVSRNRHLG